MEATPLTFTGTIAETYDGLLGPVIFEPYARELALRLDASPRVRVLELAAGTGRLTRRLLSALPPDGRLTATDLSEGMIAVGRRSLSDPRLEWSIVDATELPYPDASFDVIVCQFGVMFFPDKPRAYREARRALFPGGRFLFASWGGHDRNPWAEILRSVVAELFPGDAEPLLERPFSYCDTHAIRATLLAAGFATVSTEFVERSMEAASAESFARGFVMGTPLLDGIRDRGGDPARVIEMLVERFRRELGDQPMRTTMCALVVTAA